MDRPTHASKEALPTGSQLEGRALSQGRGVIVLWWSSGPKPPVMLWLGWERECTDLSVHMGGRGSWILGSPPEARTDSRATVCEWPAHAGHRKGEETGGGYIFRPEGTDARHEWGKGF